MTITLDIYLTRVLPTNATLMIMTLKHVHTLLSYSFLTVGLKSDEGDVETSSLEKGNESNAMFFFFFFFEKRFSI